MLPEGAKLFSWVDVEDVLLEVRKTNGWPRWIKSARAYWDGLTLYIDPGKKEEIVQWLAKIFAPRFHESSSELENIYIVMEEAPEYSSHLDIVIIETEDVFSKPRFLPMLDRLEILTPDIPKAEPENFPKDFPPLIALHSFKGGVGRTLHALALAKAIAEKKEKSVLLIDADLEAPGITWLLKNRIPNPDISFADAVTLLHGASDSEIQVENTLRLIADRVQHSCLDNIYVLPGFRSPEQFTSLLIKPEHLIRNAENPYIITHSLSQLGRMLGVSAVIADLRAGLSEFSTGFLLDRRVHQIFVTTSNPQSVQGTKYLLRLIRELTHLKPCSPKLIFSQVPFDKYLKEKRAIAEDMEERLGVKPGNIILTPHEERFTEFGHSWDEIMQHLDKSELFSVMLRWLPIFTLAQDIPFVNPENFTEIEKEKAELTESLAVI